MRLCILYARKISLKLKLNAWNYRFSTPSYHRNRNDYRPGTRFHKLRFTYDYTVGTIDVLVKLGYVEGKHGFISKDVGVGFVARMRATDSLISLLAESKQEGVADVFQVICNTPDPIVLRDTKEQNKSIIQFEPSLMTGWLTDIINAYNKLLRETKIECSPHPRTKEGHKADLTKRQVGAIFNNRSFSEGGRLYGAWWQTCPSEYRRYITINGQDTVELDFTAMQPTLLYAMKGLDIRTLNVNPYSAFRIDGATREEGKALLKSLITKMINCTSRTQVKQAINSELNLIGNSLPPRDVIYTRLDGIIDLLEITHHQVADLFYHGIGTRLQAMEAQIMYYVINHATTVNQVPILTVHDSFICAVGCAQYLRDLMVKGFQNHFQVAHGNPRFDIVPEIKLKGRDTTIPLTNDPREIAGLIAYVANFRAREHALH